MNTWDYIFYGIIVIAAFVCGYNSGRIEKVSRQWKLIKNELPPITKEVLICDDKFNSHVAEVYPDETMGLLVKIKHTNRILTLLEITYWAAIPKI